MYAPCHLLQVLIGFGVMIVFARFVIYSVGVQLRQGDGVGCLDGVSLIQLGLDFWVAFVLDAGGDGCWLLHPADRAGPAA